MPDSIRLLHHLRGELAARLRLCLLLQLLVRLLIRGSLDAWLRLIDPADCSVSAAAWSAGSELAVLDAFESSGSTCSKSACAGGADSSSPPHPATLSAGRTMTAHSSFLMNH